ncbi:MAG: cupin domain-containing protein [Sulfitobacter sp.]
MDIIPAGKRPSEVGPAEYFTGMVRMDPVIAAPEPARLRAVTVTFEPGARTAWHTHPLGQTLVVLSGAGLAQTDGGPVRDLRPGDTVWFAPNERHWHGAAPTTGMVHLALQEALDGSAVTWKEHVKDADYNG